MYSSSEYIFTLCAWPSQGQRVQKRPIVHPNQIRLLRLRIVYMYHLGPGWHRKRVSRRPLKPDRLSAHRFNHAMTLAGVTMVDEGPYVLRRGRRRTRADTFGLRPECPCEGLTRVVTVVIYGVISWLDVECTLGLRPRVAPVGHFHRSAKIHIDQPSVPLHSLCRALSSELHGA